MRRLGAVLGGIDVAQLERFDLQFARQLVHAALDAEGRVGRAGGAVGRNLRAVGHDVIADDADMREIVHRKAAHARRADRRARERAGLELDEQLGGDDTPVLFGAQLDLDDAAGGRAGAAEHLLAAHHDLDRAARLLRQRQCHRLEIDQRLAAEAAADLGRHRADVGDVDAEQLGAIGAHHEMALARAPDRALAVIADRDDAGMRLDIGLMHRLRRVAALDRDLGVLPAGGDVALREGDPLGDIGRRGRLGVDARGEQIVVQERRARLHRLLDVDDVRQHLVLHLDQVGGLLGDRRRGRSNRSNRVAIIEHLAARHAVGREVAEVHRSLADESFFRRDRWEIVARHHRLDAGQRQRLCGVDRQDAGVRVRAALYLAPQHAGHCHVGPEIGAADHLVDPVGTDRPGADDLQTCLVEIRHALLHD